MRTRELKPILDKDHYADPAARAIDWALYSLIFAPILEILDSQNGKTRFNAPVTLADLLRSGQIQYVGGYFVGKFNGRLGRELTAMGAHWDAKQKAYRLVPNLVPVVIRAAAAVGRQKASDQVEQIRKHLDEIKDVPQISFHGPAHGIVTDLEAQMKKVTPKDIEIPKDLSPASAQIIRDTYSTNLNLDVKRWTDEAILELRQRVEENVDEGYRADRLQAMILAQYGVTKRKAKFLARQETSLLVSKYRQERYTGAGINRYKWSTSHDERVRKDHKDLNGQIFSYDSPPIVDRATGRRGNPGEDFGCRCVAVPIITVEK